MKPNFICTCGHLAYWIPRRGYHCMCNKPTPSGISLPKEPKAITPIKEEKIQLYKVYKIGRKYGMSGRRELLGKGLTREQAKAMVSRYPSKPRSMVLFTKQAPFIEES